MIPHMTSLNKPFGMYESVYGFESLLIFNYCLVCIFVRLYGSLSYRSITSPFSLGDRGFNAVNYIFPIPSPPPHPPFPPFAF